MPSTPNATFNFDASVEAVSVSSSVMVLVFPEKLSVTFMVFAIASLP